MNKPLQITIRDVGPSAAIAAYIRQRAAKLYRFCSRIVACRVTLEMPHRHKTHGHHFRVRIEISVPGAELVLSRDPAAAKEHEDAYAAIDAAFDDAQRALKDWVRRRREEVRARAA